MDLVYGSFCPLHEGNARCPCRTTTINASIWTAAELGDVERVRKLVSERGRRPDSLDAHGYTPLHLAAQHGRLTVVKYLLDVGASPDGVAKDAGGCGATPLHRAAFAGQWLCVKALLAAGARPSATDSSFLDMKTPLHKAAGQGHRNVCIALLEVDADPNALDASGNTALDVLYVSCPPNTAFDLLPESRARVKRQSDEPTGGISEHHNQQGASAGWRKETSSAGQWERAIVDWDGAREALKRYGGKHGRTTCPNAAVDAALSNSGGEGSIDPPAVAAVVAEVAEEGRNRSHVDLPLGEDRKKDCGVGRTTSEAANESDAMARSDSDSAGIPCGECHLPKVVMVRSFCCGSLLCKSCARELSARRRTCHRCLHSDRK